MVARWPKGSIQEALGLNVRRQRKALGLSQEDLADEADLHRTQVGAIERAEKDVRLSTVEKLSDALKVQASDLLRRH